MKRQVLTGKATRISPEAPVLVLLLGRDQVPDPAAEQTVFMTDDGFPLLVVERSET